MRRNVLLFGEIEAVVFMQGPPGLRRTSIDSISISITRIDSWAEKVAFEQDPGLGVRQ